MKLRYTFLLLFSVLCHIFTFAQEHELEWVKDFREKTDGPPYGKRDQMGLQMETAGNGDIIVGGVFADTVDFDPSSSTDYAVGPGQVANGFIARFTPSGSLLWHIPLPAAQGYLVSLTSMSIDSDDNIYVAGMYYECLDFDPSPDSIILCGRPPGYFCFYIAKYSGDGDLQWVRVALDIARTTTNSNQSLSYDITLNEAHNTIYAAFEFTDSVDANLSTGVEMFYSAGVNDRDLALIKMDMDGNHIWARRIGGPGDDLLSDVKTDQSGNLIYAGFFEDTVDFDPSPASYPLSCPVPSNNNLFFSKLTAAGQFAWARQIVSQEKQSDKEIPFKHQQLHASMALDQMDNIYMTSRFTGTIDLDPGPGVQSMSDADEYEHFLARFTSDGSFFWAKRIQNAEKSNFYSRITGLRLHEEDIFIFGTADDTMDYDVSTLNGNFTGIELSAFIARYNSDGAFKWVRHIRRYEGLGYSLDICQTGAICFDEENNMYVTGMYGGTADFDDDGDTLTNSLSGVRNMFIAKYSDTTTTIPDGINDLGDQGAAFNLYPNPASEQLLISFPDGRNRQLEITDAVGRIMLRQRINKPAFKLDVSEYPEGLYFIRISDGEVAGVRKLVVR